MNSSAADTPEQTMSRMLGGYRLTQMLCVAARLGIADALADGPQPVDRLAVATGTQAPALSRLLRALASQGVFAQQVDGRYALTPLAATLRSDAPGGLRTDALLYGEDWWWRSHGGLLDSVRTGVPAFEALHGRGLFDYLGAHPAAAAVFDAHMSAMTRAEAQAVASAYDFAALGLLVDIGGGQGTLACEILARAPSARAIVFDRAQVVDGAAALIGRHAAGARCTLAAGDFFVSIPAGADVYTLKDILHDWDDERAVAILRRVRAAMVAPHARLLVVERIIPPGNAPFVGKLIDITMLAITGGQERDEAAYRQLLEAAGLRLQRIVATASPSSILEALPG